LERRCVIDVLPDRSADSFADWLSEHPEVTVVSRDRLGLNAEGTTRGASQAVQMADRFHLIQNLVEAVEAQLTPMLEALLIPVVASPAGEVPDVPATDGVIATITERQSAQRAQRAVVQAWFEQVMTLRCTARAGTISKLCGQPVLDGAEWKHGHDWAIFPSAAVWNCG